MSPWDVLPFDPSRKRFSGFCRFYGFYRFYGGGAAHKNQKRREVIYGVLGRYMNCASLPPPLNPLNPLNLTADFHRKGLLSWEEFFETQSPVTSY